MTADEILARLRDLEDEIEQGEPDPRPLGDPVQMIGRYPVRTAARARPVINRVIGPGAE